MNKVSILRELNEIKDKYDLYKLDDLISRLEQEVKEENYYKKPSDKKKISSIKKILKGAEKTYKPILTTIGYDKEGNHLITDSYHAIVLKDNDFLPFTYSLTSGADNTTKELLESKGIKIKEGTYPELNHLFTEGKFKPIVLNCNDIINFNKVAPKDSKGARVYKVYKDNKFLVAFNSQYMVNVINILQLENDFIVEFRGETSPIIIRHKDNKALVLPIRVY